VSVLFQIKTIKEQKEETDQEEEEESKQKTWCQKNNEWIGQVDDCVVYKLFAFCFCVCCTNWCCTHFYYVPICLVFFLCCFVQMCVEFDNKCVFFWTVIFILIILPDKVSSYLLFFFPERDKTRVFLT
jgi:hypothetical protein